MGAHKVFGHLCAKVHSRLITPPCYVVAQNASRPMKVAAAPATKTVAPCAAVITISLPVVQVEVRPSKCQALTVMPG